MADLSGASPPKPDWILLKWGTLKGYRITTETGRALMDRYNKLGTSLSCMAQRDTSEQKEIICDLIRQHEGSIQNDFNGEEYSKDQAINYIMTYGKS